MIIIPMAGQSRRFAEAGYTSPKYMLDLHGRPLFDWTVQSFRRCFHNETFVFVLRDVDGTAAFVESRAVALGIRNMVSVVLDHPTAGQADTVRYGLDAVPNLAEEHVTIFNIDTIRPEIDIPPQAIQGAAGWLEIFKGPGDNWSFLEPGKEAGTVKRTTEKNRISNLCCTGLYGFANASLFKAALEAEHKNPSSSEYFVAPIYNHLIESGYRIAYYEIDRVNVIFSGVPREYEDLVREPSPLGTMFPHAGSQSA